jgi:hypothetical protein
MVVFAQCHQQVLYGFSLISTVFDCVEVGPTDLKASSDEIDYLSRPEVK